MPEMKGGKKNPWVTKMEKHCAMLAKDAEKLAADAEKAADFHSSARRSCRASDRWAAGIDQPAPGRCGAPLRACPGGRDCRGHTGVRWSPSCNEPHLDGAYERVRRDEGFSATKFAQRARLGDTITAW